MGLGGQAGAWGGVDKAPTGVQGFDVITGGGVPRGRATLVTGASGTGKTLFGVEFLVRGALEHDEPGVLISFEETADDLATNVAGLGFDLPGLEARRLLAVDAFVSDGTQQVTAGPFDLDGLFLRLDAAVASVGARRLVIDTIESLFGRLGDEVALRGELVRLFHWIKQRQLTTIITGEQGQDGRLTRFGIEEYVSDCVVVLDTRLHDDVSTRRLRVAKYRGSTHGTNQYPFVITEQGFVVLPLTAMGLGYDAPDGRISSGVPALDEMLGGGIRRASTVMVSGSAGTGKTTIAAQVVEAACARGERALFVSFEESPAQLVRNMRSVGIDLQRWVDDGLLRIEAERSTAMGLEEHLVALDRRIAEAQPTVVALDALGSLTRVGSTAAVTATVARQVDAMKSQGITSVLTVLAGEGNDEPSSLAVSSLTDTWLLLRNVESDGERNRLLFVIKSRGTAHSNKVREFVLTDQGAKLVDVYVDADGEVLTGSRRQRAEAEVEATTGRGVPA